MESYIEPRYLKPIKEAVAQVGAGIEALSAPPPPGLVLASLFCSLADLWGAPQKPHDFTGHSLQTTVEWKELWTVPITVTLGIWPHLPRSGVFTLKRKSCTQLELAQRGMNGSIPASCTPADVGASSQNPESSVQSSKEPQ